MIYNIRFLSRILLLLIMSATGEQLYDDNPDDLIEVNTSGANESLSITNISSSLILKVLLTSYAPTSDAISNPFTSFSSSSISNTSRKKGSVYSLVDQINFYRNTQILSRIKQCDPTMTLNDLCETYTIDNNTNSLIRQTDIDFHTLNDLFDGLVDRLVVQRLNKFCLSPNWCLGNSSGNDIQLKNKVIQNRGHSFCLLEQCHPRLLVFIDTCPTLSNTNSSIPTLKILPMLCDLYNEQQSWSSTECIEEIVYLLHLLYAFWPQFETCYDDHLAGSGGCTAVCQTFANILNKVETDCDGNASFFYRVPALAWYRSFNFKEICYQKSISTRPPFIYVVEKFFSSNEFWHRFSEKPIYRTSFIIIVMILVISFSLCFYFKSKYRVNSNYRRFDNNYEYNRLHNSSFELGTNSEIANTNPTANEMIDDESQLDSNERFRSSEYQRLLFVNS